MLACREGILSFFLKPASNFQIVRWNGASLCAELLWGIKWHAPGARCIPLICKHTLLRRSTMVHHEYFSCTFGTIVLLHLFSLTLFTGYCGGKHTVTATHYTPMSLTCRSQKALAWSELSEETVYLCICLWLSLSSFSPLSACGSYANIFPISISRTLLYVFSLHIFVPSR